MSASSPRRLVTAGSLALALALATPAAAFAEHSEDPERGRSAGAQQGKDHSTDSSGSGTGTQGRGSSSSAGQGQSAGQGASDKRSAPAQRGAKGDPAGNNGTVKIDALPFDDTPGNEPHVGCTFQIDFFGFDAGDTADITLTGIAPTGGGLLWSTTDRLISTDAAGGGQDVDESITLSVDPDLKALLGVAPHAQQGWHVKLAVDVDDAPGGAKQKVFWISCAPAVAGSTVAPATAGGGTGVTTAAGAPTSAGGGTVTAAAGAPPAAGAGVAPVSIRAIERRAAELTLGAGTTALNGSTSGAATGAGSVSARSAARPSVLPFTGAQGLGYLLLLGASAVGVGALAHRSGRRRAVSS